jgi:hypothetical protein
VDDEAPLENPAKYGLGAVVTAAGADAVSRDAFPEYQSLVDAFILEVNPPLACIVSPLFDQSVVSALPGGPQSHSEEDGVEAVGGGLSP